MYIENTAQAQACAPTKKGDVELLRENEEKKDGKRHEEN